MMPDVVKEPTLVEKLASEIVTLEVEVQQKDNELKNIKEKLKRPSLGYFRMRFKGG